MMAGSLPDEDSALEAMPPTWWRSLSDRKRALIIVAGLIVVAFLVFPGGKKRVTVQTASRAATYEVDRGGMTSVTAASPDEHQLAAIDLGTTYINVSAADPYRTALDALQARCFESRSNLAAMAAKTQEMIVQEGGPQTSILTLLRGAQRAIPAELGRTNCADIFGLLATAAR